MSILLHIPKESDGTVFEDYRAISLTDIAEEILRLLPSNHFATARSPHKTKLWEDLEVAGVALTKY